VVGETLGKLRQWVTQSPRWMLVSGVVRTDPRLAALVAGLGVVSSVMPTAFSLAAGLLIGSLAQAAAGSGGATAQAVAGPQAAIAEATAGERVTLAVALLGVLFVLRQIVNPLNQVASDALGRRFMAAVYQRVMRAALRPPTIAHLEDPDLKDKIQQSLNEGWAGPRAATNGLVGWITRRLEGVIALAVVARFNVWLALLLAAALVWNWYRARVVHRAMIEIQFSRTETIRRADYLSSVLTGAGHAKEVRIFGLGGWASDRLQETRLASLAELWEKRRDVVPYMLQAALPVMVVEALGFWLVGRAALEGAIGLGALAVFATAIFQAFALGEVSETELMMEYGTAGFNPLVKLETLVETHPRLALPGSRAAGELPRESIRFEDVAFRYPGREEDVFGHLTLDIPAGRSLAIVGANGAGKTTLIKVLARLYDPTAGRILIDGTDLRELDARAWQRRVAAIFQDFQQYELPAYDNVALGAVERQTDREGVTAAARRAGALELIQGFPKGWETVLSRRYTDGIDVSGGQWQRIALARALFAAASGAPILIMDEPTAQLDVRAEAAFYDSFLDLTHGQLSTGAAGAQGVRGPGGGLTTIVISHRFSTVRRADKIVVLDRGGVLEEGTHSELMERRGRYAEMFTLQAQRFVDEVGV
jgi:ATP-binding cassette, subfamily B, bacterial